MPMTHDLSFRRGRGARHACLALAAAALAAGLAGCGGRMHIVGETGGGGGSGSPGSGGARPDAGPDGGPAGGGGGATGGRSGSGGAGGGVVLYCPPGDFKSRCHPNDGFCCVECGGDGDCGAGGGGAGGGPAAGTGGAAGAAGTRGSGGAAGAGSGGASGAAGSGGAAAAAACPAGAPSVDVCDCCCGPPILRACYYPARGESPSTIPNPMRTDEECARFGCSAGVRHLCCAEPASPPPANASYCYYIDRAADGGYHIVRTEGSTCTTLLLTARPDAMFPISTPAGLHASAGSRGPCDGSPPGASAIGGLGSAAVRSSPTAIDVHATLFFEGAAGAESVRFDVDGLTRSCSAGAGTGGAPGTGGASGGTGGASGGGGASGASCSQVTTRAACDVRSDCHSVFVDPNNCNCPTPGCCATFSRCADGDRPACGSPGISCTIVTPSCAGPYTIGYRNGCFEGCVVSSECAACDPSYESPPGFPGTCDGIGLAACQSWAQSNTLVGFAYAFCSGITCERADRCDLAGCTCGAGPACAPGQVCVSDQPGGTPTCRCAVRGR
jgi:hypothetical protein